MRTDVAAPVVVLDTTTAAAQLGPQPEEAKLRFGHVAGRAHTTGAYMVRVDKANVRDLGQGGGFCPVEKASAPPVQYVAGTAIAGLSRWASGVLGCRPSRSWRRSTGPRDPCRSPLAMSMRTAT